MKPKASAAPAWERYAAGSEVEHFAKFCRTHLVLSTDRWDGQPLELEPFQMDMMGEALAYGPDGWPVFQSVVICLPRKNAKTAILAAYAVYRLLTSEGMPEILLAASSDKQADRLFKAAALYIRRSPVLSELVRVRDYVGEIAREDGQGTIYRVASDPARLHGYDPSPVVIDEVAQFVTPRLKDAYAALTTGGGARSAPQVFSITTAGKASTRHSSILGRLLDAAAECDDRHVQPGLEVARMHESRTLVFNYESPSSEPLAVDQHILANPASWITEEFLLRQAHNPELTTSDFLQLHCGVWAEGEETFLAPDAISGARDHERRLEDGEQVVLGFDGSERRDETWLVACSLDGFVEPIGRWARPAGAGEDWRIPRPEVHAAVEQAFRRFDVLELAGDPPGWYSEMDEWSARFGEELVVMFETRQPSRMAPACERVQRAMVHGGLTFGGPLAQVLASHFGNCVARETPYGVVVTKDHQDSPRKIDGAVASIIAFDRAQWHATNVGEGILVSWA